MSNVNKNIKSIAFVPLLFLLLSLYAYPEDIARIIAKVNERVITSKDLQEYSRVLSMRQDPTGKDTVPEDSAFQREALDRLIEDTLILDAAKKEGIEIPKAVVEDKFEQMRSAYPSNEGFEESLSQKGLNITSLKKRIEEQYLMRQIINDKVRSRVDISPREISAYYREHHDEFSAPPAYVFYIAKSADSAYLNGISALAEKKGLPETVAQYPDDLLRIESTEDNLKEALSDDLKDMREGECIVENTAGSYYILCLEKKIDSRYLSLDESKEVLYDYLAKIEFRQKFQEWVDELKSQGLVAKYE